MCVVPVHHLALRLHLQLLVQDVPASGAVGGDLELQEASLLRRDGGEWEVRPLGLIVTALAPRSSTLSADPSWISFGLGNPKINPEPFVVPG